MSNGFIFYATEIFRLEKNKSAKSQRPESLPFPQAWKVQMPLQGWASADSYPTVCACVQESSIRNRSLSDNLLRKDFLGLIQAVSNVRLQAWLIRASDAHDVGTSFLCLNHR